MAEYIIALTFVSVGILGLIRLDVLPAVARAWRSFLFLVSLPMG
jgi:hypothetical protein